MNFLLPFLESLIICLFFSYIIYFSLRRISDARFKRLGGLAIIFSFLLTVLINNDLLITRPILAMMLIILSSAVFGVLDDFLNLSWKKQLFFQLLISTAAVSAGIGTEFVNIPYLGPVNFNIVSYYLWNVVFILVFINSFNWLDGIDGLAGSVCAVALGLIFILSLKAEVNQPPTAILAASGLGAAIGFLFFNFHPAKLIAGTSGSIFFGFLLAFLGIFAGAKVATAIIVALIPLSDFINVIIERTIEGSPVYLGDNRHIHFKLLKLGLGINKTVLLITFFSILLGLISLLLKKEQKLILILGFLLLYFFFNFVILKKWKEKKFY